MTKSLAFFKHRILKAQDIRTQKFEVALIGSSRVLSGFGRVDAEEVTGLSVYNCGLSGANFEEIYNYAKLIIEMQPELKVIVIGLDFFGFNEYYKFKDGCGEPRLDHSILSSLDFLPFTLNINASKDSVKTLLGIVPPGIAMDTMGFINGLHKVETQGAPKAATVVKAVETDPVVIRKAHEKSENYILRRYYFEKDPTVYREYSLSTKALNHLRDLVTLCSRKKIDLKLYITPAHSVYWQALSIKGYWPALEQWKRELTKTHPIWDFSSLEGISSSRFLDEYATWFADLNHANPCVGKIILNRIFHSESSEFGVLLTAENIETNLAWFKALQDNWSHENKETVEWLKPRVVDQ